MRQARLECIEKFMREPICSYYFLHPVRFGDESMERRYRSCIEKPMDLTTLYNKTKDRDAMHYRDNQEWLKDFHLIFDNAIRFNKGYSLEGIAKYYKKKLEKMTEHMQMSSESEYANRLAKAHADFLELIANPPKIARSDFACETPVVTVEKLSSEYLETSLEVLAEKLNDLSDDSLSEVAKLVEGAGKKNSNNEMEVDVGNLTDEQIKQLWSIVRKNEE